MSAADDTKGKVQVTLALHPGMPLTSGMHHLGTVTCEGLGPQGAFLLLDPQTFGLVLAAPCGCSVAMDLPGAIKTLREMVLGGHSTEGRPGAFSAELH